jgi:spore germination protein GerM
VPGGWGRAREAALAACLATAVLTACGGEDGSAVATPSASSSPTAAAEPTPSATSAAPTTARAVYYVVDVPPAGPRLYREFTRRPETAEPVRDAVEQMLTRTADDPDYRSLWPDGVEVLSVRVVGDLATVDLSGLAAKGSAGAAFESASVQQLVHTVTSADREVRRVQLLVEGEPRETLWGHVDVRQPVSRAPQAEVLGPVWLLTPEHGGTLARGDDFGGSASVFEATVSWEWRRDGEVVAEGFSTAEEGAPGRGEWAATVDVPPGRYELRAFESSAEDGRPLFVDSKDVTVTK